MINTIYKKIIEKIVSISLSHHYKILIITIILSLPTFYFIKQINVDTDLLKLLPTNNPTYKATMELKEKIGDGGHFIVVFDGNTPDVLKKAVEYSAEKIKNIDGVRDVQYKYPTDYIKKYKYLLIPNDYLNDLYDNLLNSEAKANPFSDIVDDTDTTSGKTHGQIENMQDLSILIQQYSNISDYHESSDGKVFGMFIPTKFGVASFDKIKEIHEKILNITSDTEKQFNVKCSIAGNHTNKLNDYDTIIHDIDVAGLIAVVLILLLLIYSFRSFWLVILVLYPLVLGLLWSFATVPFTFGTLNLITSFLTVILFGLGVDFPIHIVKRFQIELQNHNLHEALEITFIDTGMSVIISALTTAAGFIIVIFSQFRGFYEFGLLSAFAIFMIMIAMMFAFPSAMIIVWKLKGMAKMRPISKRVYIPGKIVTISFSVLVLLGLIYTYNGLKFDYYLSNTDFKRENFKNHKLINEKVDKVYSASINPAAIYAAPDLQTLDSVLVILRKSKQINNSNIIRIRSVRDFSPDSIDFNERIELITEIKETLKGEWVNKITDSSMIKLINDFKSWQIPKEKLKIDDIPVLIRENLIGNNGSNFYLINVYPTHERKDGKNAIKFTNELDSLNKISNVKGPIGETLIFADILNLVIGEAWWIVLFGQLLVFLVVLVFQKNFKRSLIMFIPLISGLLITFGIYGLFGIKITFFSVICITVVMGMGVDGGIHYINRWYYRNNDLKQTQIELFEPLSSAFLTVIFGYCGMIFSSHSGLQSIGLLSSLSMFIIWIANLLFLPGLIKIYEGIISRKNKDNKNDRLYN